MDSVEVEEARMPLEEIPLELNLRGWKREGEAEPAAGGDEAGPASGFAPDGYEPVIGLDAGDQEGESASPETGRWGAMAGDEPPEGEFSDIVPVGVFDPPGADNSEGALEFEPESTGPADSEGDGGDGEMGSDGEDAEFGRTVDELLEPEEGEDASAGPEPVWFSSLLKQGRGGSELVERWVGKQDDAPEGSDLDSESEQEKDTGGEEEA